MYYKIQNKRQTSKCYVIFMNIGSTEYYGFITLYNGCKIELYSDSLSILKHYMALALEYRLWHKILVFDEQS